MTHSTESTTKLATFADFQEVAGHVRNWGRWGKEDQLGTLNLITPDKVKQAASLVKQGKLFPLGVNFEANGMWDGSFFRRNPIHTFMVGGGDLNEMGKYLATWEGSGPTEQLIAMMWDSPARTRFSDDMIVMPLQAATQWDALSHVWYDDYLYNGFPASTITDFGATKVSIDKVDVKGIVSRGVLIDVARHRGVDYLPRDAVIQPDELDAALAAQNVSVEPGDIVVVRTGWWSQFPELRTGWIGGAPGLGWRCALWLHEHDIAAVAADNSAVEGGEPQIEGLMLPMHMLCLRDMGLMFGEIWNLEQLAADCAADGVYEFQLVAPPLRVTGAVGSPINPLAMK
jgi:kynurenine formamidase